jgi:hypothetical protein
MKMDGRQYLKNGPGPSGALKASAKLVSVHHYISISVISQLRGTKTVGEHGQSELQLYLNRSVGSGAPPPIAVLPSFQDIIYKGNPIMSCRPDRQDRTGKPLTSLPVVHATSHRKWSPTCQRTGKIYETTSIPLPMARS